MEIKLKRTWPVSWSFLSHLQVVFTRWRKQFLNGFLNNTMLTSFKKKSCYLPFLPPWMTFNKIHLIRLVKTNYQMVSSNDLPKAESKHIIMCYVYRTKWQQLYSLISRNAINIENSHGFKLWRDLSIYLHTHTCVCVCVCCISGW